MGDSGTNNSIHRGEEYRHLQGVIWQYGNDGQDKERDRKGWEAIRNERD